MILVKVPVMSMDFKYSGSGHAILIILKYARTQDII
jgi:hypothetical protein